jgi:hypothetical protein
MKSFGLKTRILGLALGAQVIAVGAANAHGLSITASAACVPDGSAVINYTVTSTSPLAEGSHNNIEVRLNNFVVDTGVFAVDSGNSFDGSTAAPAAPPAVLTAIAVGDWVDCATGGQTASVSVELPTDCAVEKPGVGRFTGGGHQIDIGVGKLTRGLTIHCDLLLSNNLEINWGGNHFHMLEHLETIECSDDPAIEQRPPVAPIDTLIGRGVGRYNGVDGYTIQFKLVDGGEPGRNDRMAIRIYETANPGNVVLYIPEQYMTGGNLQAHYDQPHGQKP